MTTLSALSACSSSPSSPPSPLAAPARAAGPADYVRGAQNSDGGFGMTQSGGSSQLATGWALLGLAAAGQQPGPAALAYVRRGLPSLRAIGDVERTVLVVRAAGQDPRSFGGRNLIADDHAPPPQGRLLRRLRQLHVLRDPRAAPLGRERSSGTIRNAARWLERHQNADGGFNVGGRGASGIDDTASPCRRWWQPAGRGRAAPRRRRSSPASRARRAASR